FSLSEIKGGQINSDVLSGDLRAAVNFKGNEAGLKAEGGLFWDKGALGGAAVKSLRADIIYDTKAMQLKNLSGFIAGGRVEGKGKISLEKDKKIDAWFKLKQLQMDKITTGKEFGGLADVNISAFGTLVTPAASAVIKSGMISFKGNEIRNISSEFGISKGSLKAVNTTVFDYGKYSALRLDADMEIKDDILAVKSMTLKDKKTVLGSVKGNYGLKSTDIDAAGSLKGIVISKTDIGYFRGKNIDGIINAELEVKGKADSPQIALDLKSDRLEIKNKRYTLKGKAGLAKNELKVSDFDFSGGLKGSAEYSLKNRLFQVNADINNLSGGIVSEITGYDAMDNSVINGNLLVKKESTGYGGNVGLDVSYESGLYRQFELKAGGRENSFSVDKLNVRQKDGSLVSSGSCTITDESDLALHMNGVMKNYEVNPALNVDAVLVNSIALNMKEDTVNFFSKLKAESVFFNKKSMPVLDAAVKGKKDQEGEFRALWGDSYSASGKFISGEKPFIDMLIKLKDADLYPVYRLAGIKRNGLPAGALIRGDIKVSGEAQKASVNAEISQDTGLVKVNGNMSFAVKGNTIKPKELSADYQIVNMAVDKAGKIADEKFEGTGRLNGSGKLSGEWKRVEASGSLLAVEGRLAGMDYNDLEVNYKYKDRKLLLEKALLYYKKTSLDLAGSTLDFRENKDIYADLKMQALDYKFQGNRLNGYLGIAGRVVTGENPLFDGSFSGDGFKFKNHTFKPFVIKANYTKDGLALQTSKGAYQLKGDIGFEKDFTDIRKLEAFNSDGVKVLEASGKIMADSGDSTVDITCQELDPQMVDGIIGLGFSWKGTLGGNVKITGNGKEGVGVTIQAVIKNGSFAGIEFDVMSGLLFLKNDWLDLSPAGPITLLKEEKYEFVLSGKIPVPMSEESAEKMRGEQMDLKAGIKDGDLSILKFLGFIDDASGVTNLTARITGTKEYPSVTGKIDVTDGDIKLKYLFKELKHVYANILIRDNVIDIYDLKGDTERGTIKIQNLDEKKGGLMKFVRPDEVNWRITNLGDRVRFTDTAYMEFLRGDADIDLAMTGKLEAPFIKGTIKASDFTYLYPIKTKTKAGEDTSIKDEDNFAKKITWDVQLTGGDNVRFYSNYLNNYADVYIKFGAAPLLLQDKGNNMKLTGNLRVIKGVYKYMNTDFIVDDLRESKVVFDGSTKPVLDVFAAAKFRRMEVYKANGQTETMDLTVNLHAYGKVGDIKIELTSDPVLPEIGN
ncbi:MAG TPA: translocation/assembly module TamB domain-containing protein, partial [Candidatus Goldiibacteriota bacterium]|nr:translocation/assembly module TamB domain-containing protein [Candidatus Goldiibacteriota bacterium]